MKPRPPLRGADRVKMLDIHQVYSRDLAKQAKYVCQTVTVICYYTVLLVIKSAYPSEFLIIVLLADRKTIKNKEERFLPFSNNCFGSRDMSFQSLGNLEKKCERKLSILCPFNKNCDVTTRICIYSIFKSHAIRHYMSESSRIWHTNDST